LCGAASRLGRFIPKIARSDFRRFADTLSLELLELLM
jgi:hypothetical protein